MTPPPVNLAVVPTHPPQQVPEDLLARLQKLDEPAEPTVRKRGFSLRKWLFLAVLLGGAGAGSYFGYKYMKQVEGLPKNLEYVKVDKGDVVLTMIEKGELEAARNTEIICMVRASGRGSNAASSIKWVIDDGSKVRKGDPLMLLDDAGLREQLNNQNIVVEEKNDLLEQARSNLKIVENDNEAARLTAVNNLKIAEIDFDKYKSADKQQKQFDISSRIRLAESDLMQWRDKSGWSGRMMKKGFVSSSQANSDENKLASAEDTLSKLRNESITLDFDERRSMLDLENKVTQAKLSLKVAHETAEAKLSQAEAKRTAAELIYKQECSKRDELEKDVRACRILAPHDGMAIYFVSESSRFGGGSSQATIAPGEPVKEGQKLMRIPNLAKMVVRIKTHESVVSRLKGDQVARTGFGESFTAAKVLQQYIFPIASHQTPGTFIGLSGMMPGVVAIPEVLSYHSDLEEEVTTYGQPAKVKVPSVERPLDGHVKMVSAVASASDNWNSPDVKVYNTLVAIDETPEGLKPNMSAEVTVQIAARKGVLRLPVQAILASNNEKFCYVRVGDKLEKRSVRTGLNSNKFIELLAESQVKEGEEVVINPRTYAEKMHDLQTAASNDPSMNQRSGRRGAGEGATPGKTGTPGKQGGESPGKSPGKGGTPAKGGEGMLTGPGKTEGKPAAASGDNNGSSKPAANGAGQ